MSLSCPPASPEAKGLVEDIFDIITKSEKRQRARKADEVPVFKSAVGLIIGYLLIGFHTKEAGWSYLSMSTSAFSDRPVGYKTFKTIVETMEEGPIFYRHLWYLLRGSAVRSSGLHNFTCCFFLVLFFGKHRQR